MDFAKSYLMLNCFIFLKLLFYKIKDYKIDVFIKIIPTFALRKQEQIILLYKYSIIS
jgi:hypothetical protein